MASPEPELLQKAYGDELQVVLASRQHIEHDQCLRGEPEHGAPFMRIKTATSEDEFHHELDGIPELIDEVRRDLLFRLSLEER